MKPVRVVEGRAVPLERSDVDTVMVAGEIRKRAGKVRDLDVQLAALRSLKAARRASSMTCSLRSASW